MAVAPNGNVYVGKIALKPEVAITQSATADRHEPTGKQCRIQATPYLTYVDK